MHATTELRNHFPDLAQARSRSLVLFDDTRTFYRGHLNEASRRTIGGYVVCVALDRPLQVRIGDAPWVEADMAVIEPYQAHSIRAFGGRIGHLMLETETVCPDDLPAWLTQGSRVIACPTLASRWARLCAGLDQADGTPPLAPRLDTLLFGAPLPQRVLDARVASVIQGIVERPGERHSAQECAQAVGLSMSRFLHLFRQETGTPFRPFRAWKCARRLLDQVSAKCSLTDMALDSGYADSSHFSNSIRDSFGVKPRDVLAGFRRMPTFKRCNAPASAASLSR